MEMNIESYRDSIANSLKEYKDVGQRTAYAFGYLQSACSSTLYTRKEIRELADLINYELSVSR